MIKLSLGPGRQIDFPEDIILQHGSEIRAMLLTILSYTEIKTVLEIGTWEGGTAFLWGQIVDRYLEGKVVCVDVEFGSDYPGCPFDWGNHIPPLYRKTIFENRITEVKGKSNDPKVIREVEEVLGGKRVDLLFIDGDHSYGMVKHDFETYVRFVKGEGWVAFHDAVNRDVSCSSYWTEMKKKYDGKEFVVQNMPEEIQEPHKLLKDFTGIGLIQWRGELK
jgi:cephalosporin hydroxylase